MLMDLDSCYAVQCFGFSIRYKKGLSFDTISPVDSITSWAIEGYFLHSSSSDFMKIIDLTSERLTKFLQIPATSVKTKFLIKPPKLQSPKVSSFVDGFGFVLCSSGL
ncbi:hypothetical protein F511_32841 [Dorcoceras hygrometricum]|uniref:Uncharacterized protein n=1 Tax=Dorcoceras hygrometricum TaxID=472368 RepID=A0A2Z7CAM1_9LAMI|nr:hypothetical protein F511_32841 [Dorcoceras hygrometricum]